MNRKGVSFVELLVYVVLFAIVTILIGTQLKQLVKGYSSGRRISRLQSDSRDVLAMLSREIRNTGCKFYLAETATDRFVTQVESNAYVSSDSSSFICKEGDPSDTLKIYKVVLSNSGELGNVEQIEYFLDGTTLVRKTPSERINLADNIYALQFQYGIFDQEKDLLTGNTTNLANWSTGGASSITVDNTNQLFKVSAATTGIIKNVKAFTTDTTQNVWVHFQIAPSNGFPENLDSIKCTIRSSAAVLATEKFGLRDQLMKLKMPVVKCDSAYVSFDVGAKGSGNLKIKSLLVKRADLGAYLWKDYVAPAERKYVKAIRIHTLVRSKDKVDTKSEAPVKVANITITRSGNYAWRLYTETVEIVNNGEL